ncbi:MAG TPA: electron transfer flavoprotein subunit alpha/FixB family protein, partial [Thermoplasmatales archaeon]|nr:electron transfer flavoprotein subunit alpha/FixB family protein [Thermoplasmatales archaeon]
MVLVYSEKENIAYELLNKGRELADKLGRKLIAVVIGGDKDLAKNLIAYGADEVVVIKSPVSSFKAEEYADILKQVVEEKSVETILIGSTKNGKELASRLSGILKTGCIIDAVDVYLEDNKVYTKRVVYSGNAVALQGFNSKPAIVTIPPRLIDPLPRDDKRKGEIEEKEYKVKPSSSSIVKITEMQTDSVNVEEADIIVSCGRGFKNKEDLKLAEELAEALKGKTIG